MARSDMPSPERTFYTVAETAKLFRVDPATIYRAIRHGGFPAIKVRSRYVVPVSVVTQMAELAAETGSVVDVGAIAAERRIARQVRAIEQMRPE